MNKARRNAIEKVIAILTDQKEELEALRDEEQEAYDNLPEGIQYSERGEAMEENINDMDTSVDELDYMIDRLQEMIER